MAEEQENFKKRSEEREKNRKQKQEKYESQTTAGARAIAEAMNVASQRARIREMVANGEAASLFEAFKEEYREITGKDIDFYEKKSQNRKVAFVQFMQHNIQTLVENDYLTTAQESFLFKISGYIDFQTNIIVERDYKNSRNKKNEADLPKAANINYIADLVGIHRTNASKLMNQLKEKGILGTAETGMVTEDGRICTSRTWFVNPNVMYCGDKADIDKTVQFIFRDALKNIKDKNGKKIKLPVKLFLEDY
ncbi:hypothetical protein [Bacillus paramycoides]|uniref:hypothetical protein n=1 Tax=Bacillus paramycoides TaxID=2026194 RepID=UPI003CFFEFC3